MVKSLFLVEGEFNSLYAIWGLHYVAKMVKWWTRPVTLRSLLNAIEVFYY